MPDQGKLEEWFASLPKPSPETLKLIQQVIDQHEAELEELHASGMSEEEIEALLTERFVKSVTAFVLWDEYDNTVAIRPSGEE